LFGSQIPELCE
jgi:pyroglutamyl-peptidase